MMRSTYCRPTVWSRLRRVDTYVAALFGLVLLIAAGISLALVGLFVVVTR